jgi:hypothetical protein
VAVHGSIRSGGALTDELTARGLGSGPGTIGGQGNLVDERTTTTAREPLVDDTYGALQQVRAYAVQAIGLLTRYAPDDSPALQGEIYAIEGYADVFLAELFCSGVPLSTLDYNGDFTYKPSSTTDDVYARATALFDSALAISADSVSVMNLARVGKARILLRQGEYAQAAQMVAVIPDEFTYELPTSFGGSVIPLPYNVATREGRNGLPFYTASGTRITSNDPRAWVVPATPSTNSFGVFQVIPVKYPFTSLIRSTGSIVVASGVEARLIQAEAALHAGTSDWLTILNTLRTDETVVRTYTRTCVDGVSPCPAGVVDTTWGPGIGAYLIPAAVQADNQPVCEPSGPCTDTVWYKGLRPLADPGAGLSGQAAFNARLDLLMQERAYWLFLTGHRQADLRRLVHTYGRQQNTVYPIGPYYGGFGAYGSDVSLPIPSSETANPLFHGCLDRGA